MLDVAMQRMSVTKLLRVHNTAPAATVALVAPAVSVSAVATGTGPGPSLEVAALEGSEQGAASQLLILHISNDKRINRRVVNLQVRDISEPI